MLSIPICVSRVLGQIAQKEGCTTRKHSCLSTFLLSRCKQWMVPPMDRQIPPKLHVAESPQGFRPRSRPSIHGVVFPFQPFTAYTPSDGSWIATKPCWFLIALQQPCIRRNPRTQSAQYWEGTLAGTTRYLVWPPNQHKIENNLRKFQITLLCVISTVKTIFMREWWHVKKNMMASDVDSEICSEFWQAFFLTCILTYPWRLFGHTFWHETRPKFRHLIWQISCDIYSDYSDICIHICQYMHSPGPCYENARDMGPREAHNNNSSSNNSNSSADPTNIPQFTVFLGFPMCPFIIYNIFVILYPHFFFIIYLWSFTLMWAPGLLSGVNP